MAMLTDEERAARIEKLNAALAQIDADIATLEAQRTPLAVALASLTDQEADYSVTLKHGDDRELTVIEHGASPDDAARKAMTKHPGFTAQHKLTTAIPKDFPDPVGPTIEEYVKAGYDAKNYPPPGYAAVDSPGWRRVQAGQPLVPPTAPPPPSTPAPPTIGTD